MKQEIIIDRRYCGPPDSGNGGYTCGLIASYLDGIAEVTLRRPPPLGRPLRVEPMNGNHVRLVDGRDIVAEANTIDLEPDAIDPPSFSAARTASEAYTGFEIHPFPTCFVCGPDRRGVDALRIFPGALAESKMVAAPWIPGDALVHQNGKVKPEFIWAALDCPGAFAVLEKLTRPIVLGRMATRIQRDVHPGEKCVVVGWPVSADGRKHDAGTALYSEAGELAAFARATWILPGAGD